MSQNMYVAMCVVSQTVDTARHRYCLPWDVCRMSSCWPINSPKLLGAATFKVQKVAASFEKLWVPFVLTVFRDPLHLIFVAGDPIITPVSGGATATPHTAQWAERRQREKKTDFNGEPLILFIVPRILWWKRQNSAMYSFTVRTRFGPSHVEGRFHLDPPASPSFPHYHTVLDRTNFLRIKLCSSSLFYGFIVFSTYAAENDWNPDPSLKNTCYEILQT